MVKARGLNGPFSGSHDADNDALIEGAAMIRLEKEGGYAKTG